MRKVKRTGRPRVGDDDEDDSVPVCVRLPSSQYDRLYEQARRDRASGVPEVIRRQLREHEQRRPPKK
jgi:hypothetical protein